MKNVLSVSIVCCGLLVSLISCSSLQGSQEKDELEVTMNSTDENLAPLMIAQANQLDEDIQMDDDRYGYGEGRNYQIKDGDIDEPSSDPYMNEKNDDSDKDEQADDKNKIGDGSI